MDALEGLTPFLPVIGIIVISTVFSIYVYFYRIPNTPELLGESREDIEAPLLILDSS